MTANAYDVFRDEVTRLEEKAAAQERLRIRQAIEGMTGLTTDDIAFRERVLDAITPATTPSEPAGLFARSAPAGRLVAVAAFNGASKPASG